MPPRRRSIRRAASHAARLREVLIAIGSRGAELRDAVMHMLEHAIGEPVRPGCLESFVHAVQESGIAKDCNSRLPRGVLLCVLVFFYSHFPQHPPMKLDMLAPTYVLRTEAARSAHRIRKPLNPARSALPTALATLPGK